MEIGNMSQKATKTATGKCEEIGGTQDVGRNAKTRQNTETNEVPSTGAPRASETTPANIIADAPPKVPVRPLVDVARDVQKECEAMGEIVRDLALLKIEHDTLVQRQEATRRNIAALKQEYNEASGRMERGEV
jgi:hypothetical protein